MEITYLFKALFLGVIEGLTEFLPVSSTGHLILVSHWIAFESQDEKVFEVVIQLGAILAVCWLYRAKIASLLQGLANGSVPERRFAVTVMIAFFPAAVIGALFIDVIKSLLFSPAVVVVTMITGGLIILAVEGRAMVPTVHNTLHIRWRQAVAIGMAQCVAMIPGTSRSGATIIGGMLSGLSRQTATEFSFFLAIPTMLGAATYDMARNYHLLSQDDLGAIAVGFTGAFISALLVVKALVQFVARYTLRLFAWYRIGLGTVLALWLILGEA